MQASNSSTIETLGTQTVYNLSYASNINSKRLNQLRSPDKRDALTLTFSFRPIEVTLVKKPWQIEPDQKSYRPEIDVGTDNMLTLISLVSHLKKYFEKLEFANSD